MHMVNAANKVKWVNAQRFPVQKSRGTYRIVCLGGSTTYGRSCDDTACFSGWLRELLPLADPTRQWQVVNAGGIQLREISRVHRHVRTRSLRAGSSHHLFGLQ